jgi:tetratricopeptide (TPR) repeat protein
MSAPRGAHPRRLRLFAGAALVGLVLAVYLQAVGFGFVFDDGVYVTDNPTVRAGLSAQGIRWAFSGLRVAFWHPLTWISHMLDVTLFGLNPGGHHLTAVLLHAANAVACFLVLQAYAGATWPAAFAAALFAIHPLRAESVAYVAERKDVLSALFWFLTMAAWLRYLRRPTAGRYAASLGTFVLGLAAKPMLITLPFALLLLDYWPLDRLRRPGARLTARLVLEKAPFFVLSVAASVVAYVAQKAYGSLSPVEPFGLGVRLVNALYAYAAYVGKTLWPIGLGAFYPHPGRSILNWWLLVPVGFVAAATAFALATLRRRPFVAVGWFWYLGTLVPVIGLVQIGDISMADRWTYLPAVGLSVVVAWGGAAWAARGGRRRGAAAAGAIALLLALASLTFRQVGFWHDGVALFSHTLQVTGVNPLARYNLSVSLIQAGRRDEAAGELRLLIAEDPSYVPAYHDLAVLLAQTGRTREAIDVLTGALARFPRSHRLHYRLALILEGEGRSEPAERHLEEAIRLRPSYADALLELGVIRGNQGRFADAERLFREALAADPASELARWNLEHLQRIGSGSRPGPP